MQFKLKRKAKFSQFSRNFWPQRKFWNPLPRSTSNYNFLEEETMADFRFLPGKCCLSQAD